MLYDNSFNITLIGLSALICVAWVGFQSLSIYIICDCDVYFRAALITPIITISQWVGPGLQVRVRPDGLARRSGRSGRPSAIAILGSTVLQSCNESGLLHAFMQLAIH